MRRKRRGRTAALITWAARALAKTRVAKEKEKKKKHNPKPYSIHLKKKEKVSVISKSLLHTVWRNCISDAPSRPN